MNNYQNRLLARIKNVSPFVNKAQSNRTLISKCRLPATGLLLVAAGLAQAEAPVALIGGEVNNNIDVRGAIINAGAGLGGMNDGDVDLEVSIGTVHGNSEINGDLNNDIIVYGAFGAVTVVNAGLSWQGTTCAKTSIGSIGASTCTYDGE